MARVRFDGSADGSNVANSSSGLASRRFSKAHRYQRYRRIPSVVGSRIRYGSRNIARSPSIRKTPGIATARLPRRLSRKTVVWLLFETCGLRRRSRFRKKFRHYYSCRLYQRSADRMTIFQYDIFASETAVCTSGFAGDGEIRTIGQRSGNWPDGYSGRLP